MVRYDWVVKYDLDIICLVRYDEEWMVKYDIQLLDMIHGWLYMIN